MKPTLIIAATLLSDWTAANETPVPEHLEMLPNPDGCGQYSQKRGNWCVCLPGFKMEINPTTDKPYGGYDRQYHYTARKYMHCVVDSDYLDSYHTDYCAPENGNCSCRGTVLFGDFGYLDSSEFDTSDDPSELVLWKPVALKAVDGSIQCTIAEFRDPLPGKKKHCICVSEKRCDDNSIYKVEHLEKYNWTREWCQCKNGYRMNRDSKGNALGGWNHRYNFEEVGKKGFNCVSPGAVSCMNAEVLQKCLAWGRYSKEDNGCLAFAKGWKKQTNDCDKCSATTRAYDSCDRSECVSFCLDMYRKSRGEARRCVNGCDKYAELGRESGLFADSHDTPAPTPYDLPPGPSPFSVQKDATIFTQYQSTCMNAEVLQKCLAWGRLSKEDNGCLGFAAGWKKKDNDCHSCSATQREYTACSKSECTSFCGDMYRGSDSEVRRCVKGCDQYAELLAADSASLSSAYVVGEEGSSDCPEGYAHIPTHEECIIAAQELDADKYRGAPESPNRVYASDWVWTSPYCSLDSGGHQKVYFNTNFEATNDGFETPICKLQREPQSSSEPQSSAESESSGSDRAVVPEAENRRRLEKDIARRLLGSEDEHFSM